jgi:sulfide:quinone oxidoreductase
MWMRSFPQPNQRLHRRLDRRRGRSFVGMPKTVLIVGGGIAAVECGLALREHASDRVVLVAPEPELVLTPMLVAEALGAGTAYRVPLTDFGFEVERATVIEVDVRRRRVLLRGGGALPYETLVLAPGARTLPAFEDAVHLPDAAALDESIGSVDFIAPTVAGWLLPLYEAALLTAHRYPHMRVTLVTPEQQPLQAFGDPAVADALDAAGVTFAHEPTGADRIVSLPLVRGSKIPGVPTTGLYDFIPVDGYQRVVGLSDAYAIGDATDFPVKQGGLACAQAEVAAAHIAGVPTEEFRPQLRATLLTGTGQIALGGGQGPEKIPGRRVAQFLSAARAAESPGTPWTAPPGNVAALPK